MQRRTAFTLIELLVVVAIVAVLAVVVVIVLNPAQLLQQARDSNRISDLATVKSSLGYYLTDAALSGTVNLGASGTVYVSVPDPSATSTAGDHCEGLSMPSSTYIWRCAASSTYRKTDTTGWIPVNLAGMANGSPLGQFPIDPTNATSAGFFYTYSPGNGVFEMTAMMESQKYQSGGSADKVSTDGGYSPNTYEAGTSLTVAPFARSLMPNFGDFEGSDNSVASYAGATVGWTTAYGSVTGASAENIVGAATGGNSGGFSVAFPTTLTVGRKYTFSFYAKSIANPGSVAISIQNDIGDNNCLAFNVTPTSQWQLYTNTCALDLNKHSLYVYGNTANQQFVIDDIQLQAAP